MRTAPSQHTRGLTTDSTRLIALERNLNPLVAQIHAEPVTLGHAILAALFEVFAIGYFALFGLLLVAVVPFAVSAFAYLLL